MENGTAAAVPFFYFYGILCLTKYGNVIIILMTAKLFS